MALLALLLMACTTRPAAHVARANAFEALAPARGDGEVPRSFQVASGKATLQIGADGTLALGGRGLSLASKDGARVTEVLSARCRDGLLLVLAVEFGGEEAWTDYACVDVRREAVTWRARSESASWLGQQGDDLVAVGYGFAGRLDLSLGRWIWTASGLHRSHGVTRLFTRAALDTGRLELLSRASTTAGMVEQKALTLDWDTGSVLRP